MFTTAINSVKEILSKEIMRLNSKIGELQDQNILLQNQNMALRNELEEKELQLNLLKTMSKAGAKLIHKIGEDGVGEYWSWEVSPDKEVGKADFQKDIHYP